MDTLMRIAIIAALLMIVAARAEAQDPARDTTWRPPSAQERPCSPGLDLYRSRVRSLSRHAGWGMFIGASLGTAYGLVQARGPLRGAVIIWDGFIGGTSGMVVGSGVYAVRRLRGYSPPTQPACRRDVSNRRPASAMS